MNSRDCRRLAGSLTRGTAFAMLGLGIGAPGTAADADRTPLLHYASGLHFPAMPHDEQLRAQHAAALGVLRRTPPPAGNCAQSLGAARFAMMLAALGDAEGDLGRHEPALAAYERALECHPRDPELLAARVAALHRSRRNEDARRAVDRALAIEPEHEELLALRAQLDFALGRWESAAPAFARLAQRTREEEAAAYRALLGWLAERHMGRIEPRFAVDLRDEDWPGPLARMLRGELDEATVLAWIVAASDELRRREMLAEALYYAGENRLLSGDRELALRHFAAVVNLKVLYFVEHDLALARLSRLRAQE